MANKRYYWLKLMKDFFQQARIKKLRKIPGGDTYVVIYLKMLLLSINTDGIIIFESIEPTFEEELALTLDEDLDAVKVLVAFLAANKLIEKKGKENFFMVEVSDLIGSETASTQRSKKSRNRKKEEQKLLHCNTSATTLQHQATKCNTEIEKEIDIEKDNTDVLDIDISVCDHDIEQTLQLISKMTSDEYLELLHNYIHFVYKRVNNYQALVNKINEQIKLNQDKKTLTLITQYLKQKKV
jgi:predicted phage replisome organizer